MKNGNSVTTLCDGMRWDRLTTSESPANYKTKSKLCKSTNYNYKATNNKFKHKIATLAIHGMIFHSSVERCQSTSSHGARCCFFCLAQPTAFAARMPSDHMEQLNRPNCENPTWFSAERSVTLHSFDFTEYRLWTSLFWRGTIVNGQIVVL